MTEKKRHVKINFPGGSIEYDMDEDEVPLPDGPTPEMEEAAIHDEMLEKMARGIDIVPDTPLDKKVYRKVLEEQEKLR